MAKYILELPKEVQLEIRDKAIALERDALGEEYFQEEYGISLIAFVNSEVMREKLVNILDYDEMSEKYGLTPADYKDYLW